MPAPNWSAILDCSERGPRPTLTNAVRVLQHDPTLGPDRLWYDEFLDQVRLCDATPRAWRDDDDTRLTVYLQDQTGLVTIQQPTVAAAVRFVARQRPRHVVRDWMRRLVWDAQPRVHQAFSTYWGAAADVYTISASYNFFVGLAARILHPGCKLDTMPVFEGPQGLKKSSALQVLGGPWYSIAHEAVGSKDFLQGLRGVWLLEIAELQSFSKADVTAVKNTLSAPQDDYRPSYGRAVVRFPRQCVMAGTTNTDDWASDETGLRRFWPIRCGPIALDALCADREQLVAEAVALVDAGAQWWEMPPDTAAIQADRQHFDEWTRPILDWCRLQVGGESVALKDILAGPLHLSIDRATKADQHRAARILKLAGWERKKVRLGEETAWVWAKGDDA